MSDITPEEQAEEDAMLEQVEKNLAEDWDRLDQASIEEFGMTHDERVAEADERGRQQIADHEERTGVDVGMTTQARREFERLNPRGEEDDQEEA